MKKLFKVLHITLRFLFLSAFMISVSLLTSVNTRLHARTDAYTGDPRTIAHDFLDREKEFGAGNAHYAMIDGLINKSIIRIKPEKNFSTEKAIQVMLTIDSLLKEEGFIFKNNLLLTRGLERKEFDCDNYCALYIAVAEVLKIPVVPVYAPNHTFLRFCFEDGTYLNWETTQGKPRPDSYYMTTLKIPEESARKGVYMKNLTRKEFIAVEYNNIGAHLMTGRKYNSALSYLGTAISLNPLFSSAYHNRGSSFYAMHRIDEAIEDLLKANGLDPSQASTHNTLGDIYFDKKEYENAVREYVESVKLDPTNYAPYNSIGLIMKVQGQNDKARVWLRKSRETRLKYGSRDKRTKQ